MTLVPEDDKDLRYRYHQILVWGNRQPWLIIRRILWIVTAGWAMFLLYILASASMVLTIIFIPFVPQTVKLAVFALDPVTIEAHADPDRFRKPLIIAANIIWAICFGWFICLGFVAGAIVQTLTIIGIPTALTLVTLGKFALMPFGCAIRQKFLPTTVAELRAHAAGTLSTEYEGAPVSKGGDGRSVSLASKDAPQGLDAV